MPVTMRRDSSAPEREGALARERALPRRTTIAVAHASSRGTPGEERSNLRETEVRVIYAGNLIEGAPIEEVRPGDIVWFEAGERHWHGASPTSATRASAW
jgi:hypothetical protein